ncbi:MAG TPA: L-lysine 6-transaminase [Vicinamibacterales bacterium]|jgi:L-lysine 6-transaminase
MKSVTTISPALVHETLGQHILADGYDMVLDVDRSKGRRLWDARRGRAVLDMFSFFATAPLGLNHPKMADPVFREKLLRAALANPTNSDIYTVEFAEFVSTFARVGIPPYLPYAFFVAGGALGVENALKAAMDWKVRRNFRKGLREEKGHQVIHFRDAFHGRTGYTMSLTNTADPRKYQYFAKFDWPRITNPALHFPLNAVEIDRVAAIERQAIGEIEQAFASRRDDIAAIIIEPIQAEGGDNHYRPEFLQALRRLADEHEALLIFDEVQAGVALTGRFWAHQHFGVQPDLLAFGKKMQVCGMLAGPRIDEEPENVFKVSSRLNSTWGGNLVDMVRSTRYLEIIEEDGLVEHAAKAGAHLQAGLEAMQAGRPDVFSNARGRGLMCAIDFPDTATRDKVGDEAYELGLVILSCGRLSLRFRPPLDVTTDEIDEALDIIRRAAKNAGK